MNILDDPTNWKDYLNASPPVWWQALATDGRYWFYDPNAGVGPWPSTEITYIGAGALPATLQFAWEIVQIGPSPFRFRYTINGGPTEVVLGNTLGSGSITVTIPSGATFSFAVESQGSGVMYGGQVAIGCVSTNYNCDCDDVDAAQPRDTLLNLRKRLLRRLGYAAQALNPPPGMAELLTDFLQSTQITLYNKYTPLRTKRFFTWAMVPGVRFYDIPDNIEQCTKRLDAYKLDWVGIEDAEGCTDGQWARLVSGIPPEFYTSVNRWGIPTRYEIRQCIEVFPAPDRAYKLRIKGHFGLEAFTADTDKTTIDSELLFLWTLGVAKNHYGQPDAKDVVSIANAYLFGLVAGKHGTQRYVPASEELTNLPKPIFLPLQGT